MALDMKLKMKDFCFKLKNVRLIFILVLCGLSNHSFAEYLSWSAYANHALFPTVAGASSPAAACNGYISKRSSTYNKLSFYALSVWTRAGSGGRTGTGAVLTYVCDMKVRSSWNYGRDWGDSWELAWITRQGTVCPDGLVYDNLVEQCSKPNQGKLLGSTSAVDDNSPKACTGNQINFASGNKFQQEKDIESYSGLEFIRQYNSVDKLWRHNYSARLNLLGDSAVVILEDGRDVAFTVAGGVVTPNAGERGGLEKNGDGWVYYSPSKERYYFNIVGTLVSLARPSGQNYSVSNNGFETTVTNALGDSIRFRSDAQGQPLSVTDGSVSVEFKYNASFRLDEVVRTENGVSKTKTYHYEDSRDAGLLTGVTDERGVRYATWAYDGEGRAISSEHAGSAEKVSIEYKSDGSVVVTNSLGKNTAYKFQAINGVKYITSIEGESSANCPDSNSSFSYDGNGLLKTRTDNKGNVTTYSYNSRNLEVARTEGAGTPQARTVSTEWHPTLLLPIAITEPNRVTRYQYDNQGRQLSRTVEAQ